MKMFSTWVRAIAKYGIPTRKAEWLRPQKRPRRCGNWWSCEVKSSLSGKRVKQNFGWRTRKAKRQRKKFLA